MILEGLKDLHKSMRMNNLKRAKFDFQFTKAKFKCLFFTDQKPYLLVLAIRGTNFFMKIEVKNGYKINTYIDPDKFQELMRLLGFKFNSDKKFSANSFFQEVNNRIPNSINMKNYIYPYEVAPFIKVEEEPDKKYFWRWIMHDGIKSNVSPENLEKTRTYIGQEAFELCREKNITSQWTNNEKYKNKVPSLPK